MPEKLPRLRAREIITALEKLGFVLSRQSGSHKIYKNVKGKRATVPFHGDKILHPKIVKRVMEDAELSVEDLKKLI
jgi:predicted RNA binding protein YcfA (HicA-like mRNA interferase family)